MSQDHGNIGLCLLGLGDVDAALVHLNQAIELTTQAGMRQDQAYWLRVRADGLVQKGQYDLGLHDYRAAFAIYESVGAQAELVEALHDYGQLHLLLGDSTSAERDFKRALAMARSIGLDRGVTLNLISLGDVEFRRKRLEAAIALYEQARQRAAASGVHTRWREPAAARPRESCATAVHAGLRETDQSLDIAREISAPDRSGGALPGRSSPVADAPARRLRTTGRGDRRDPRWRPGSPRQIHLGRPTRRRRAATSAALASLEAAVALIEDAPPQEPGSAPGTSRTNSKSISS
jgi:tetratricopeptide (TPR) repeat protein